jgi:hypothetical protein
VGWIHESKFDGYRTQAHLRNGRPAIYTRRAHDWTRRFQTIADALKALPAKGMILDGEAVADRAAFLTLGCFTPIWLRAAWTGCSTMPLTCSISTGSICAGRSSPNASACSHSSSLEPPTASSTPKHLASFELDAPIRRVYSAEVPMPYAAHLEQPALPQPAVTAATARIVVRPA